MNTTVEARSAQPQQLECVVGDGQRISFGSAHELAMAINAAGGPVAWDLSREEISAAVRAAVLQMGQGRVIELAIQDATVNARTAAGKATAVDRRIKRALWSAERERACLAASALFEYGACSTSGAVRDAEAALRRIDQAALEAEQDVAEQKYGERTTRWSAGTAHVAEDTGLEVVR